MTTEMSAVVLRPAVPVTEAIDTMLLHYQHYSGDMKSGAVVKTGFVSGIELSDGTHMRSHIHDPALPEHSLALAWPTQKVDRIAAFYDRYLMTDRGESNWNCHSFVAAVMGWEVKWDADGYPHSMPREYGRVDPTQLEDQQPYRYHAGVTFKHSSFGLPNPTQTLSVWGIGNTLRVASNEMTMRRYGDRIYRHKEPNPQVMRIASKLIKLYDEFPHF